MVSSLLLVSITLGENTATVFLHVESHVVSLLLAFAESGREIGAVKFHTIFLFELGSYIHDELMILVWRYEQCCSECVESVFARIFGGFRQPQIETVPAAPFEIGHHPPQMLFEVIAIDVDNVQTACFLEFLQGIEALFVFSVRVNVWVIPETGRLVTSSCQLIEWIHGARSAAYMYQYFHGISKELSLRGICLLSYSQVLEGLLSRYTASWCSL